MAISNCYYCGISYCEDIPEDVKEHEKQHERKQLAERIFGFIAPRNIREYIKDYAWNADTMASGKGTKIKEKPLPRW